MNKLFIPPPINWYERNIAVCAPDNTVVYGSRSDIIVVEPKPPEEPANVRILPRRHSDRVVSVGINPGWSSTEHLIVSASEDKTVLLWNLDNETVNASHGGHTNRADKLIGATFAGNEKIVSVSEEGYVIVWRYRAKELDGLANIFGNKVKVTCISSCPHASCLIAFGLKQGTIIIADLRGTGKVMYRLIGHETKSVSSLSWCPTPYNVFPTKQTFTFERIKHIIENEPETNVLPVSDDNGTDCNTHNAVLQDLHVTEGENTQHLNETSLTAKENQTDTNLPVSNMETKLCDDVSVKAKEFSESLTDCSNEPTVSLVNTVDANKSYVTELHSAVENCINANVTVTDLQQPNVQNKEFISDMGNQSINIVDINPSLVDTISANDVSDIVENSIINNIQNIKDLKTDNLFEQVITNNLTLSDMCPRESTSVVGELPLSTDVEESTAAANILIEDNASGENILNTESHPVIDDLSEQQIPSELVKEYLLASTVQGGRSIIIWRAGTDGHKQIELQFHSRQRYQRNKRDDTGTWISLCWLKPKSLLSSSLQNDLVEWNFSSNATNKKMQKYRIIHSDHKGYIFSIVAPTTLENEFIDIEDWRDRNMLNVWTFGKDRVILNISLSVEHNALALYPTFSGGVNSIISSPVTQNRFAVISGDGYCRLWDISMPHCQYISMSCILERSKIVCLAWHPTSDIMFAFGTSEGKVALMDSSTSSKKPSYLVHHFDALIQKVEWGPLQGNLKNMGLYVLSNGKVVVYDTCKSLNAPNDTNLCSDDSVVSFAWKPDYNICAMGTKNGTVILASRELKSLVTLYLDSRPIRCLAWHRLEAVDDLNSNCLNWLALSSNELKIYDCASIISGEPAMEESNYYENIIASFNEHTSIITWLAWSPLQEGIIASASEDGSALVWNVKTKILLHCCRQTNLDSINCVEWSPYNTDFIITGSKDSNLTIWKLSENLPKEKISRKNRRKILNPLVPSNSDALNLSEQEYTQTSICTDEAVTIVQEPKKLAKHVLSRLANIQNNHDNKYENCQNVFDFIFNQSTYESDIDKDGEIQVNITQIFGSKEDVNVLLELEKKHNSRTKYASSNEHISLWQGNIGEHIKKAISQETLNPWLINLAPMVSPSLWQEACAAYADQLSKCSQKDPYVIASYYLACHNVEAAVEALCSSFMFREALALAKIRLLEGDPLINSVLKKWLEYARQSGQIYIACQCYIALNQLENAAKLLFRDSDALLVQLAAEFAKRCENKDLLEAIEYKLTTLKPTDTNDVEILKPLLTRAELELKLAGVNHSKKNVNTTENGSIVEIVNASEHAVDINEPKLLDANVQKLTTVETADTINLDILQPVLDMAKLDLKFPGADDSVKNVSTTENDSIAGVANTSEYTADINDPKLLDSNVHKLAAVETVDTVNLDILKSLLATAEFDLKFHGEGNSLKDVCTAENGSIAGIVNTLEHIVDINDPKLLDVNLHKLATVETTGTNNVEIHKLPGTSDYMESISIIENYTSLESLNASSHDVDINESN